MSIIKAQDILDVMKEVRMAANALHNAADRFALVTALTNPQIDRPAAEEQIETVASSPKEPPKQKLAQETPTTAPVPQETPPAANTPPVTESAQEAPTAAKSEAVTLEQVRAVLADKSRAGHTAAIKELLVKHGADKLSDIKPENYAALLAEAEGLK